jgi:type VI secretion system protein VasG
MVGVGRGPVRVERARPGEIDRRHGTVATATAVTDAQEPVGVDSQGPVELQRLKAELSLLQAGVPLVKTDVDGQAVAEVISAWTGVPVGRMLADEVQTLLELEQRLGHRVIGQDHALKAIAEHIRMSRAKVGRAGRPIGVFLLVGPSGVGKTETALALAETLYGGEHHMVTINMSEYQESHTVSKLKGSPRVTWDSARAACSPSRCVVGLTAWCVVTRSTRRIRT